MECGVLCEGGLIGARRHAAPRRVFSEGGEHGTMGELAWAASRSTRHSVGPSVQSSSEHDLLM